MRCSTPLRRCSPSRAPRARRERECHLYFARRVTFLSCADTRQKGRDSRSPIRRPAFTPRYRSAILGHEWLKAMQSLVLKVWRSQASNFPSVIPEIDIWRAANLMLKRYGPKAVEESAARADELAAQDDYNGAAVWRRITDAVGQLANTTPSGRPH